MRPTESRAASPSRAVFRAIVVCLAAGAVVVGAAVSTGSRRPEPRALAPSSLFGGLIPIPPGAYAVMSVADAMEVNGIPMRVAHFQIDSTPAEVLGYYLEAFEREGLEVDGSTAQEDGGGLVAWDSSNGLQRAVTVFRQGSATAVFPWVATISRPESAGNSENRPLPPGPAGARLVSDVVSRDGARHSRTISMLTPLEIEVSAADLERRLTLAGYHLGAPVPGPGSLTIEAKDPKGRPVVYTLTGGRDHPTGVLVVMEEM